VPIQYVGQASGINSATLPAHQAGDLILAFAFRDGSTTIPALPAGYTNIRTNTNVSTAARIGYVFATNSSTLSGTWTGATSVLFQVYRGVTSLGGANSAAGLSTVLTFPAVTITNTNGFSWVAGFVGHASNNVAITTAPSGMVNRSSYSDTLNESGGHDTNGGVISFASRTASVGGTSNYYISMVVEMTQTVVNASTTVTGLEAVDAIGSVSSFGNASGITSGATSTAQTGSVSNTGIANKSISGIESNSTFGSVASNAGALQTLSGIESKTILGVIQPFSTWYSFFFDPRAIASNAGALSSVDDEQLTSSISDITAGVGANQLINGIELNSSIETIYSSAEGYIVASGVDLTSSIGDVSATIGSDELITGEELTSEIGLIAVSGDAFNQLLSIDASLYAGDINTFGDSNLELTGFDLSSNNGLIEFSASSNATIDSQELISYVAPVTASTDQQENATIAINGVQAGSNFGFVSAYAENEPVIRPSGRPRRYSVDQVESTSVKISGIQSKIQLGSVKPFGVISISAATMLNSVTVNIEVDSVSADGVLFITEEELMLMMAA
jgi:hypothetical protein